MPGDFWKPVCLYVRKERRSTSGEETLLHGRPLSYLEEVTKVTGYNLKGLGQKMMDDKMGQMLAILSASLEKDNKMLKKSRVLGILVLCSMLIESILMTLGIGGPGMMASFLILTVSLVMIIRNRESLLIMRVEFLQYLLISTAELGHNATDYLLKELEQVSQKYHDKKSRLEDLVGPDIEDVQ